MNFKQLYNFLKIWLKNDVNERLIQKAASSVNNIADTVSTDITDKATDTKPIVLEYEPNVDIGTINYTNHYIRRLNKLNLGLFIDKAVVKANSKKGRYYIYLYRNDFKTYTYTYTYEDFLKREYAVLKIDITNSSYIIVPYDYHFKYIKKLNIKTDHDLGGRIIKDLRDQVKFITAWASTTNINERLIQNASASINKNIDNISDTIADSQKPKIEIRWLSDRGEDGLRIILKKYIKMSLDYLKEIVRFFEDNGLGTFIKRVYISEHGTIDVIRFGDNPDNIAEFSQTNPNSVTIYFNNNNEPYIGRTWGYGSIVASGMTDVFNYIKDWSMHKIEKAGDY
jgi:hypothetical protein